MDRRLEYLLVARFGGRFPMRLTLSHCCCRQRAALDGTPPAAVETPNGSADAAEAFAWMNRQLTWQSLLADLEVVSWLATGDPPT